MTYTGLELFMQKLKQLNYSNDNPLIKNHPSILSESPKIQRLYEALDSMIQTLFVDHDQDLPEPENVRILRNKFRDAAKEAEDIVDLFVFAINFGNKRLPGRSDVFKSSLDLEDVMRSIKLIKQEFMTTIMENMKMDSSQRAHTVEILSAYFTSTSFPTNLLGPEKVSEEIIGLDDDAKVIVEKLMGDQRQLAVISIVGMAGLGKTTLATKVFHDPLVLYHFHIRAWVNVSPTYQPVDLLIQILRSIDINFDPVTTSHSELREKLHKILVGMRYLIVVDDIWSIKAWEDLKLSFPDGNTRSRILLTSRIIEVALYAKSSYGFVRQLRFLTDEESWVLLCKKVFHGNDCPKSLIELGMQIAKGCHGLPLAVVITARVLETQVASIDSWEGIARIVGSYPDPYLLVVKMLVLIVDYLPSHLRDSFLYLCCFPENYMFRVRILIRLWMAEGFINEVGERTLEEIAEDYLTDLVKRNLVVVVDRKFSGRIKTCCIHDFLRVLFFEKATKEHLCLMIHWPMHSRPSEVMPYKQRRIFTNNDFYIKNFDAPVPRIRSLLMVLDLQNCQVKNIPAAIALLFHLRYLAISCSQGFPSLICNLWSLQTLIFRTGVRYLVLPDTISNLVNLRHLWSDKIIYIPSIGEPMNLQAISDVVWGDDHYAWKNYFPCIKKLRCIVWSVRKVDFKSYTSIETLKLTKSHFLKTRKLTDLSPHGKTMLNQYKFHKGELRFRKYHFWLPASLKQLTLVGCGLPWIETSLFQSLPKLEVLKIIDNAFKGPIWEVSMLQFRRLKFLKMQGLNIQKWKAVRLDFPCLKRLELVGCKDLEMIPLEFGYIRTLELIEVDDSSISVLKSVNKVREEQEHLGRDELKIRITTKSFDGIENVSLKTRKERIKAFSVKHEKKGFAGKHVTKTGSSRKTTSSSGSSFTSPTPSSLSGLSWFSS